MLAAFLLTALATSAGAGPHLSDEEILRRAEAAVASGRSADSRVRAASSFREAAAAYEELGRRGAWNADLFRNLGNAHLLSDDLPRTILAYRQGLRLAPGDPGLRAGLQYARDRVVYFAPGTFSRPPALLRPAWLLRVPAPVRLAGVAALYAAGWAAGFFWWATGRRRWLAVGGVTWLLAGLLAVGLAAQARREMQDETSPTVVVAKDGVLIRKGNGFAYPPRYETPLNGGVEARLRFDRGDWLQIELAGGEVGWVPRSACLVSEAP